MKRKENAWILTKKAGIPAFFPKILMPECATILTTNVTLHECAVQCKLLFLGALAASKLFIYLFFFAL